MYKTALMMKTATFLLKTPKHIRNYTDKVPQADKWTSLRSGSPLAVNESL